MAKKEKSINVQDVILNYFDNLELQDIKTGIPDIDSGMLISQSSFTLIAGVTGSSKTAYMLNIANYNINKGKCALFINLKDSVENLSMKILSMNTMTPIKKLLLGQINEQEGSLCIENIITNENNSLFFYNASSDYFKLDRILLTIKESNADLVIIDDLQMIELEKEEAKRNKYVKDKMDYILKRIKALCLQSGIPIIGTYCISTKKLVSEQTIDQC